MNITRNNCQQVISSMLCSLPCGWKDAISNAICNAISSGGIGQSGYSGYSGLSGAGIDGLSGYSGYSGSGLSGYSGFSGLDGGSAFSGASGYSGFSGDSISGFSGYSGYSGGLGISGYSGYSGFSGSNPGLSGYSGYSGSNPGVSGFSGFSGANPGSSGFSGYSGFSGFSGAGGASGFSGVAAAITADNALIMSTPTNVQFGDVAPPGAPLLHNTYVDMAGFTTTFTGAVNASGAFQVLNTDATHNVIAIYGQANSGAAGTGVKGLGANIGVVGQSVTGAGVEGIVTSGVAFSGISTTGLAATLQISPTTNNVVTTNTQIVRFTSTPPAVNGIGTSIDFSVQDDGGSAFLTNQIISKWTNVVHTARTSQLSILGLNNAVAQTLVTLDGDGTSTFLGPSHPTNTVRAINTTGTGIRSETTSGTGIWSVVSGSGIGGQFNSISGVSIAGIINPATTGIVETVAQFERHSSGTATNGIGGQLTLYNQNAAGTVSPSNQIEWIYTNVTAGAETSQMKFGGMLSNVPVTMMTLNGDGSWDITPISATAASAITPNEGKLVFVNSTNGTFTSIGLWDFENGAWHKL